MASYGIQPDNIQYNLMISICSELEKAEKPLGFPQKRVEIAEMFFRKIEQPDVISYNALLNVYSRAGLREHALDVEAEMECVGVKMTEVTYNTLMNGCILAGNYRAALIYVEKARASGELNQIGFSNAMEAHYKLGQVK